MTEEERLNNLLEESKQTMDRLFERIKELEEEIRERDALIAKFAIEITGGNR